MAPILFAAVLSAGILMVPAANGQHLLAVVALATVIALGWAALIVVVGRGAGWRGFERDFWAYVAAAEDER